MKQVFLEHAKYYPIHNPFTDYQKQVIERKIGNEDIQDWRAFDKVFVDTEWIAFTETDAYRQIMTLLSHKTESKRAEKVEFTNEPTIQPPQVFDWNGGDIKRYFSLNKVKSVELMKHNGPDYRRHYYNIKVIEGRLVAIVEVTITNDTEEQSTTVDTYYYDEFGRLVFIDADHDTREAELYNGIFLVWEKDKIKTIYNIFAIESHVEMMEPELKYKLVIYKSRETF